MEEWKQIKGYDDYYVSSRGNVYSKKTEKIMIPSPRGKTSPYLSVVLRKDGAQKTYSVHRLVAEAFIPNPYGKETVNHLDGDKTNNNVTNLEWATRSENDRHAYRIGLRRTPSYRVQKAIDSRKRKVINLDTCETFNSIAECARAIGVKNDGVGKCVRGERERYKGMRFSYIA